MAENANPIYEPRKFYEQSLKQQYHAQAEAFFDELVKQSEVDGPANANHVKDYKKSLEHLENIQNKASSKKVQRGFIIFAIVLCFIAAVIFCILFHMGWWMPLIGLVFLAGGIALIVYVVKVLNKVITGLNEQIASMQQKSQQLLDLCYQDLEVLNRSYDWNIPCSIMKKTTPILDLDPYFSASRFAYLVQKFGMPESLGDTTSCVGVLSGHIQGNPFVLEKDISEEIIDKAYTGSIVITWTTTYSDKDGTHTQHHSETLTATVYHEAPQYEYATRLIYGNEAAPHLHFSRVPSGQCGDDKSLARFVKKRSKELTKKEKDDLLDDDPKTNFTKMGNDKFDALFGADDRDNEVEFRLLYTPLAQKNILDLLTNPEPFGDDFVQVKDGMLNSISSGHSQTFDYGANPVIFRNYDLKDAKKKFVDYCDTFIRNLYFDLCPIISVPLYQTYKPMEFIYENMPYNLSNYEHEVMANGMDPEFFRPEEADPDLPLILKVSKGNKSGMGDRLTIHCLYFKTTPQVDYVPKLGGDGNIHQVPVHWIQYDLVEKEMGMEVASVGGTQKSYAEKIQSVIRDIVGGRQGHYERGLYCYGFSLDENCPGLSEKIAAAFQDDKAQK